MPSDCRDDGAVPASKPAASDGPDGAEVPAESVEAAAAGIREEAETVRQRELAEALARLEARGSLSDEQRDAVAAMTERLVARLLGPPMHGLDAAREADDPETAETVRRLFGSE